MSARESTATESETTSEGPPPLPPEAQQDDEAGAVAFVEHWVELVNYAITTGDVEPAEGVTSVECGACEAMYETLEETGGPATTGEWTLRRVETRQSRSSDPEPADFVITAGVLIEDTSEGEFGEITAGVTDSPSGRRIQWLLAE